MEREALRWIVEWNPILKISKEKRLHFWESEAAITVGKNLSSKGAIVFACDKREKNSSEKQEKNWSKWVSP